MSGEVELPEDTFDPEVQNEQASQLRLKVEKDVAAAKQLLGERKRAYYHLFVEGTPAPEDRALVLKDLSAFCRAEESTFHENDRVHALLTGRQEVMLRIGDYMRLDADALFDKYAKPPER